MDPLNRRGLLDELEEQKVKLLTELEVVEVTDQGATVVDKNTGKKRTIAADVTVIAMGTKAVRGLADSLKESDVPVYVIGDCQKPRKIMDATYEGSLVARQI